MEETSPTEDAYRLLIFGRAFHATQKWSARSGTHSRCVPPLSLSLSRVSPSACSTGRRPRPRPPAPQASGRSSNTSSCPEKPPPRRWMWLPPVERSSSRGRGIRHPIFPHAGEAGARMRIGVAGAREESTGVEVFQAAAGRRRLGPRRRRQSGTMKRRLLGALKIAMQRSSTAAGVETQRSLTPANGRGMQHPLELNILSRHSFHGGGCNLGNRSSKNALSVGDSLTN
jgi:hypothetical protein